MGFSRAILTGAGVLAVAGATPVFAQDETPAPRYALSIRTAELMSANSRGFFGTNATGFQFSIATTALVPQFSPASGTTSWDIEYVKASSAKGSTSAFGFLAVERFPFDNDPDAAPGTKPWIGIGFGLSQLNVRLMNPGATSQILLSDSQFKTTLKFAVGAPITKKIFIEASARFYGRIFGFGPNQYSLDAGYRF
jgi:hypothetical protein